VTVTSFAILWTFYTFLRHQDVPVQTLLTYQSIQSAWRTTWLASCFFPICKDKIPLTTKSYLNTEIASASYLISVSLLTSVTGFNILARLTIFETSWTFSFFQKVSLLTVNTILGRTAPLTWGTTIFTLSWTSLLIKWC